MSDAPPPSASTEIQATLPICGCWIAGTRPPRVDLARDGIHGWPGHRAHVAVRHGPCELCRRRLPPDQADEAIAALEAERGGRPDASGSGSADDGCPA